jgi:hypothetical protein
VFSPTAACLCYYELKKLYSNGSHASSEALDNDDDDDDDDNNNNNNNN